MSVIVYSLPNCPKCRAAKALLKRLEINFEEFDVTTDKEKGKEMVEKRRKARPADSSDVYFPVLDINGTIIEGFDRAKIEKAVKAGAK